MFFWNVLKDASVAQARPQPRKSTVLPQETRPFPLTVDGEREASGKPREAQSAAVRKDALRGLPSGREHTTDTHRADVMDRGGTFVAFRGRAVVRSP